jgi:hypothetical protein
VQPGHAREAHRFVPAQCRGGIGPGAGEAGGEGGAVLDGLSGSLGEEREHGVAGVAEQRDASGRPAPERGVVEERPDERLVHGGDDGADLRVPALERLEHVGDVAAVGPGLAGPGVLLDDRHEVDQAATRHEVVHEVPSRPHPHLGGDLQSQVRQAFRGHQPAVGDAAGEPRMLRPEQEPPHGRLDPVRADQHVGLDARAVGEPCLDPVPAVGQAGEPVPEVHPLGGQRARKRS